MLPLPWATLYGTDEGAVTWVTGNLECADAPYPSIF